MKIKFFYGEDRSGKSRQAINELSQYPEYERFIIDGKFIPNGRRTIRDINQKIVLSRKENIKALLIDDVCYYFDVFSLSNLIIDPELLIVSFRTQLYNTDKLRTIFNSVEIIDFKNTTLQENEL